MRLHRLTLENWRGVANRTLEFDDQVTLIEGPNEIGKSTVIEALHLLLNLRDDSKRQEVKAIQPVGQDVGSWVEVEFSFAGYLVLYAKRFNKKTETTLNVLQPQAQQLSGREAHEHLTQLLEEHVDLNLWNALLVDQGAGVKQVGLQDSASLVTALDTAAGAIAQTPGDDNSSLFAAVQAEYESYYTLAKGNPKFTQLEGQVNAAQDALHQAQQDLQQIADFAAEQERLALQLQVQQAQMPQLQASLTQHEAALAKLSELRSQIKLLEQELKALEAQHKGLLAEQQQRTDLKQAIAAEAAQQAVAQQRLAPLVATVQGNEQQQLTQVARVGELKRQVAAAQAATTQATDDEIHVKRLVQAAEYRKLLASAEQQAQRVQTLAAEQAKLLVDAAALEELRAARAILDLAIAKRDTAATSLTVEGLTALALVVDGVELNLSSGQTHEHKITERSELVLPGQVRVEVTPPQSVAQLQEEAADGQLQWQRLLDRFGVNSMESAVATHAQRMAVDAELAQIKIQQAETLAAQSVPEVQEQLAMLAEQSNAYLESRTAATPIPTGEQEAAHAVQGCSKHLMQCRAQLDEARAAEEAGRQALDDLRLQLTQEQESQIGQAATLAHQRQRLDGLLAEKPAEQLGQENLVCGQQLGSLQAQRARLAEQWQSADVQQLELLRDNSQESLQRSQAEIVDQQQRLAVLMDRLEGSRASGSYEVLETSEADHQALVDELAAVKVRASAAKRLWETLTAHRASARAAYVAPLKTAIESLGGIVFGTGFAVEVAQDWSIVSRTVQGKTLPFAALSIGAQEQLSLLTRLAAAQIAAGQGGVPLLIDDALGFSDPARLASMGAAIAAAGRSAQVIILTCSPGRFANVGNARLVSLQAG